MKRQVVDCEGRPNRLVRWLTLTVVTVTLHLQCPCSGLSPIVPTRRSEVRGRYALYRPAAAGKRSHRSIARGGAGGRAVRPVTAGTIGPSHTSAAWRDGPVAMREVAPIRGLKHGARERAHVENAADVDERSGLEGQHAGRGGAGTDARDL